MVTRRSLLPSVASFPIVRTAARAQEAPRTFHVVTPYEINGLDPACSGFVFTRLHIAETLLGADHGGLPWPQLARSWTVSEDRLVWRFSLREGARFHDGTP